MNASRNQSFIVLALSFCFFLVIFWVTFAPTQLGGWVTYVIVDGNSMEPRFRLGDLLLVRAEPTYGAGDAVVYRNAEMNSYVFHRIIGTDLDRFVLKGDNNSWVDSYQPVRNEIIGKLWIHIPKLGKAVEWVRIPINMSLTVGLLGGALMLDTFKKPSQRRKIKNAPLRGVTQAALYGFAFLALLFLALGIYSFTRPLDRPAENIPYEQEASFFYSATGTPGVYDTDTVRSGEPIFPKLTCFLNVGFTYNLIGERIQDVSGNYTMYARVLDEQSGWQRTIPLNPGTSFSGNSYSTTAILDLCQVESLVNIVEQEAGLKQIAYTLEIVTDISFTANAGGNQIRDSFSPKLIFKYDKIHFYLAADAPAVDPLHSSKPGLAGSLTTQPNTISIFGLQFYVRVARYISLFGLGFSLLGLIAAGWNIYQSASQNQEALIRLKYGAMLVDVFEQNLAPVSSIIEVATMDDLARLAERLGTMILHMKRNFLHYYLVQGNAVTYRYVISAGRKGAAAAEQPDDLIAKTTEHTTRDTTAVIPAPVRREPYEAARRENKAIHVFPVRNEIPQPVITSVVGSKVAKPGQDSWETVEYVINTGRLEFELPRQETTLLRKITL